MFAPFFEPYILSCIVLSFLVMLLFPRTLVYSLCLVLYVSLLVVSIVFQSFVRGLLGLLLLMVYVGAMIVIISYICAVSPNIKYTHSLLSSLGSLVFALSAFLSLFLSTYHPRKVFSFTSPSFMFTDTGMWFLLVVALFIVLVLMFSTYISPVASSLRSVS